MRSVLAVAAVGCQAGTYLVEPETTASSLERRLPEDRAARLWFPLFFGKEVRDDNDCTLRSQSLRLPD
jgi:hypothetical protein